MSRGIYLETYIPLEYVRTRILLNVEFSIRDSRGAYSSTHVCIRLKNGQEIYIYINTLEDPIRLISNKNFSSEQFDTSSWMLEMHRKTRMRLRTAGLNSAPGGCSRNHEAIS